MRNATAPPRRMGPLLRAHVQSFRDRLIAKGLASVAATEDEPDQQVGCRRGFALCRHLVEPAEYELLLLARNKAEKRLCDAVHSGRVREGLYWRYRCATLQIEYTLERLKAMLVIIGYLPPDTPLSCRAALQTRDALVEARKAAGAN